MSRGAGSRRGTEQPDRTDRRGLEPDAVVDPQIGAEIPSKELLSDPDIGKQVFMLQYAAGFTNAWHTHPHATTHT